MIAWWSCFLLKKVRKIIFLIWISKTVFFRRKIRIIFMINLIEVYIACKSNLKLVLYVFKECTTILRLWQFFSVQRTKHPHFYFVSSNGIHLYKPVIKILWLQLLICCDKYMYLNVFYGYWKITYPILFLGSMIIKMQINDQPVIKKNSK